MLQQVSQAESRRTCQAVSPMDEPCDSLARYHCAKCGQWFCEVHAEDEWWHACALEPGEEGGEA